MNSALKRHVFSCANFRFCSFLFGYLNFHSSRFLFYILLLWSSLFTMRANNKKKNWASHLLVFGGDKRQPEIRLRSQAIFFFKNPFFNQDSPLIGPPWWKTTSYQNPQTSTKENLQIRRPS